MFLLVQIELERECMALALQEEKKAQAERERRLKEQEQKIENLSTMVINSAVDDRDFDKRNKKVWSFSLCFRLHSNQQGASNPY